VNIFEHQTLSAFWITSFEVIPKDSIWPGCHYQMTSSKGSNLYAATGRKWDLKCPKVMAPVFPRNSWQLLVRPTGRYWRWFQQRWGWATEHLLDWSVSTWSGFTASVSRSLDLTGSQWGLIKRHKDRHRESWDQVGLHSSWEMLATLSTSKHIYLYSMYEKVGWNTGRVLMGPVA
jgi:hypothetical protein